MILMLLIIFCNLQSNELNSKLKFSKWETPQGLKVYYRQSVTLPMLEINLMFKVGSYYDPKDQLGITNFTTEMISLGDQKNKKVTIIEDFEFLGTIFKSSTNQNSLSFYLKTITKEEILNQSLSGFYHILKPVFSDNSLKIIKNQILQDIRISKQKPDKVSGSNFRKKIYQKHGFAHDTIGTTETISNITTKMLQDHYDSHFGSKGTILIIHGNISLEKAKEIALNIAKILPIHKPLTPIKKPNKIQKSFTTSQNIEGAPQSSVLCGYISPITIKHPDYFKVKVANYILGANGLTSKLAIEVREKKGLAYTISSGFSAKGDHSIFYIYFGTHFKQRLETIELVKRILTQYGIHGPTKDEIEKAREFFHGSFPMMFESQSDITNLLSQIAFYDLPDDWLDHYNTNIDIACDHVQEGLKYFQDSINISSAGTLS